MVTCKIALGKCYQPFFPFNHITDGSEIILTVAGICVLHHINAKLIWRSRHVQHHGMSSYTWRHAAKHRPLSLQFSLPPRSRVANSRPPRQALWVSVGWQDFQVICDPPIFLESYIRKLLGLTSARSGDSPMKMRAIHRPPGYYQTAPLQKHR